MSSSASMVSAGPSLDDCLKLLRGERDEQKLAGLLLATKFCQGDDNASILEVYQAVGPRFLDRLLLTGMGKATGGVKGGEDREAYLRLALTVLAGFCRVTEIASSEEMVSKVPLVAEIVSKSSDPSIFEECYEYLLLVATASENSITKFYEPRVMDMLAPHISTLTDGSRSLELAMRLLQLVVNKLSVDMLNTENLTGISCMVASIAKQFAVLQNAFKFDALHLLTTLLSSNNTLLHGALRSTESKIWAAQIRIGIMTVLQNRVVSAEKLQALLLAESMMSIVGENWLLECSKLNENGDQDPLPVDKFLLLVLESSRIEVAVLLNELAYLKYEASKSSSNTAETIVQKQRNLAISFSLIEKIIKLISNICGAEGHPIINERTLTKAIAGLNETINLVLDFLQDSKDHGQRKGDDLLAAVRIIGSYLAETPLACKEKTRDLLGYILSIEGENESSPFYSICFLLPMLCQITMEVDGCKALASFEGHIAVVECLVKMIGRYGTMVEDNGPIFLACDTILNFLLNRNELQVKLEGSQFIHLLKALALWTESSNDPFIDMMASSICALVFDLTSEESLLNSPGFDRSSIDILSRLLVRCLNEGETSNNAEDQVDLHQIITAGYHRWADRFPHVRNTFEHVKNTRRC
ncbi:uncharacterized protein LOC103724114 [Phoenix dactylifera]|uniref:Uncharacterized protein LOC103724114 n=1 Tax=Phoenix dactylifera TaxID=42345 RepID=A0A8B7D5C1_PHODC|nr:uncharacterized protein LOC103724114 [Phoenix dactylifera]